MKQRRLAFMAGSSSTAGFTLIEMIVVVFIIGLLATVVAINVIPQGERARRTKALADLKKIEDALKIYKLDAGRYPTTGQGLQALIRKPSSGRVPRRYSPEGYLDANEVPTDPWGSRYAYLSDGRSFTLRSLGADGEPGGEGDDADIDSKDTL